MKAMIYAAGLGTRLHPITQQIPKALVQISGKPLLEILIEKFIKTGIHDIIINVHHFAEQIIEFVNTKENFGINIQFSDERNKLLDTGGGLKKASWFFDDGNAFLVHNADVLSDIDLNNLVETHLKLNAIATVAVRKRTTSRYLLFDQENVLCGWENIKTGERIMTRPTKFYLQFGFSGIHVINPSIFNYMEEKGKFSIIESYLKLAKHHKIISFDHTHSIWLDLGKNENLQEAEIIIDKII
ncbi:MAG: nucleotidyltransferase family protein [Bacteroidales bacterium]|nr:nucleotidyltransferase family protein [Bacteroidales bacterium]